MTVLCVRLGGDETAADPGELADAAEVEDCCGCDGGGVNVDAEVEIVVVVVVVAAAAGVGIRPSGKLSLALNPRNLVAAMSYAIAASSAVSKVPSQTRAAFCGSRISAAHFPHGRCLTPRYLRFFGGGNGAAISAGSEDGPPPSAVGGGVALALPSPSNVLVRVCTVSAQQTHHQCNRPKNIMLLSVNQNLPKDFQGNWHVSNQEHKKHQHVVQLRILRSQSQLDG